MSLHLIAAFSNLPLEVVHMICLSTGKFIFDKNGRLKSIVDLRDYESIKCHLPIFRSVLDKSTFCRPWLWMSNVNDNPNDNTSFILYIHCQIYNRPIMNKDERIKSEIIHYQNADYNRHPLLFLKEAQIEDVMFTLKDGLFCEPCKNELSSTTLELYSYTSTRFSRYHRDYDKRDTHYVFRQPSSRKNKQLCKFCLLPICLENRDKEKEEKVKKEEKTYQPFIQINQNKLHNKILMNRKKIHSRLYR